MLNQVDVGIDCCRESVDGRERDVAVELVLEVTEIAFYEGVVEAVAFPRQRLHRAAVDEPMPGGAAMRHPGLRGRWACVWVPA